MPAPRRGPAQQLDLDEIVGVGIAIADAEGLAAVSTRAVAARLDRTAMALYPYVGTKENLLALMQDQASALPPWADPATSLADALLAWSSALFEVYLAHPWLTDRPWSQASQGPHEQDWLERLAGSSSRGRSPTAIGRRWSRCSTRRSGRPPRPRRRTSGCPPAAQTSGWPGPTAIQTHVPDLRDRYPLSTSLAPPTPDWRANPRAALTAAVRLLAAAV